MEFVEGDNRFESYVPPSDNKYDYSWFWADASPEGELLARQIQAQSYVNMHIVRPEGLMTLDNGAQIIAPDVSNPSGNSYVDYGESHAEYIVGIKKDTTDMNPLTGQLVAWRKFYAPLDALPAYQFCRDGLWPGAEMDLREIQADPNRHLAEPEALGKTQNAEPGVIKEFIRNEIQRVMGKGEVWYMGLVEKTAYRSWVHNWGSRAVRKIGEAKLLTSPHNYDDVALVPTVVDVDNFYANMAYDIMIDGNDPTDHRVANFVYMANGLSDEVLGPQLAWFRAWAQHVTEDEAA